MFIGSGAHQAQKLNIPGNELNGVMSGIDFLREVNLGCKVEIGDDVVVVGGGSTAMDAARLARRLGAGNVRLVYRRTRTEMPAQLEELVGAEAEGESKWIFWSTRWKSSAAAARSAASTASRPSWPISTIPAAGARAGRRQRVHHPRQFYHLLPGPETQPGPDRWHDEPGQARPYRRGPAHHGHQRSGGVRRRRRRQPLHRDRERGSGQESRSRHRPLFRL